MLLWLDPLFSRTVSQFLQICVPNSNTPLLWHSRMVPNSLFLLHPTYPDNSEYLIVGELLIHVRLNSWCSGRPIDVHSLSAKNALKLKMVINGISSSELCFYLQAMHIHRVQRMLRQEDIQWCSRIYEDFSYLSPSYAHPPSPTYARQEDIQWCSRISCE